MVANFDERNKATMKGFKSSLDRLARFFKKSRDSWKQRALEYQKKNRALEVRVRDLTKSRDEWKRKAKMFGKGSSKTEKEQNTKHNEISETPSNSNAIQTPCEILTPIV